MLGRRGASSASPLVHVLRDTTSRLMGDICVIVYSWHQTWWLISHDHGQGEHAPQG